MVFKVFFRFKSRAQLPAALNPVDPFNNCDVSEQKITFSCGRRRTANSLIIDSGLYGPRVPGYISSYSFQGVFGVQFQKHLCMTKILSFYGFFCIFSPNKKNKLDPMYSFIGFQGVLSFWVMWPRFVKFLCFFSFFFIFLVF